MELSDSGGISRCPEHEIFPVQTTVFTTTRVVPRPYTFDYIMYITSTSYKERSMTYPSRVSAVSLTIRDLLAQPPIYVMQPRDVLTTEARMPTNSEAIGVIFIS